MVQHATSLYILNDKNIDKINDIPKTKGSDYLTMLTLGLISHSFPLWPTGLFLEGNEGNMEEIGGRARSWENLQERARLSAILWAPRGEIILGVLEMPGTPQKQKGAVATITKQIQKLAKK